MDEAASGTVVLTLDINELCSSPGAKLRVTVLNLGGEVSKELHTPHGDLRVKVIGRNPVGFLPRHTAGKPAGNG